MIGITVRDESSCADLRSLRINTSSNGTGRTSRLHSRIERVDGKKATTQTNVEGTSGKLKRRLLLYR